MSSYTCAKKGNILSTTKKGLKRHAECICGTNEKTKTIKLTYCIQTNSITWTLQLEKLKLGINMTVYKIMKGIGKN